MAGECWCSASIPLAASSAMWSRSCSGCKGRAGGREGQLSARAAGQAEAAGCWGRSTGRAGQREGAKAGGREACLPLQAAMQGQPGSSGPTWRHQQSRASPATSGACPSPDRRPPLAARLSVSRGCSTLQGSRAGSARRRGSITGGEGWRGSARHRRMRDARPCSPPAPAPMHPSLLTRHERGRGRAEA